MTVDALSVEAYQETESKREFQRTVILDTIAKAMHPSSADLARLTSLPRSSVTGRLKELENEGAIYKAGTKKDPFTKKTVHWYAVAWKVTG